MRFKAPKGQGAPTLRCTPLMPAKDNTFAVTHPADIEAMRALGYIDADAPLAAAAPAPDNTALRGAVRAALKALGTTVPAGAGDDVLAKALGDLPAVVEAQRLADVKAAEEAVLAQLANKSDGNKKSDAAA